MQAVSIIDGFTFATILSASEVAACSDTGDGQLCRLSVTQVSSLLLSVCFSLYLFQDVWLETSYVNYNSQPYLLVAKHLSYAMKRSLLQFQDLPRDCTHIKWAKMYIYYIYAHKPSWMTVAEAPFISRPL